MKFVKVNNFTLLRLCTVLIVVSMLMYLPTTLVFGQNKVTHSIAIDKNSGSNANILESSRVEYNSSGWTSLTIIALDATYQVDGEEKDYFTTYETNETDLSGIYLLVYSGISNELIVMGALHISIPGGWTTALENESTVSLVMYILNDDLMFESIEVEYSIEAVGGSVGTPQTINSESSLPFSSVVFITAFATLGIIATLISLRRIKFKK